jgi:multidrug efflux pump subunit AcrB
LEQGILDDAAQIAVPAFVSTLCICIVFVPMFLLTGVTRYPFVPLAEGVVFAMLPSYVIFRDVGQVFPAGPSVWTRCRCAKDHLWAHERTFENGFDRLGRKYSMCLKAARHLRWRFGIAFLA